jgi:hypothetical protein
MLNSVLRFALLMMGTLAALLVGIGVSEIVLAFPQTVMPKAAWCIMGMVATGSIIVKIIIPLLEKSGIVFNDSANQ